MENPFVTFIAESILTGDRSLSSTIAHEIAHFWSGNLVTNANWKHFWLNEGITTYLTRKALKEIHGKEDYYLNMKHGLFRLSRALIAVKKNTKVDSSFRSLKPNVKNFDPYIAFSSIPYEKGSFLLHYIEKLIGNKNINSILKTYFKTYRFKSITTGQFVNLVNSEIKKMMKNGRINRKKVAIPWKKWIYGTEMIPVKFNFDKINIKIVNNQNNWLNHLKSSHVNYHSLYSQFKKFKLGMKSKLLVKAKIKFDKFSKNSKKILFKLLQIKELIFQIRIKCIREILLIQYLHKSSLKRRRLVYIFDKLKYYSVAFVKAIFSELKKLGVSSKKLLELLKKYQHRLHPLTKMRVKEFILHHKTLDK